MTFQLLKAGENPEQRWLDWAWSCSLLLCLWRWRIRWRIRMERWVRLWAAATRRWSSRKMHSVWRGDWCQPARWTSVSLQLEATAEHGRGRKCNGEMSRNNKFACTWMSKSQNNNAHMHTPTLTCTHINTYIHTSILTYILTYLHKYKHTYS